MEKINMQIKDVSFKLIDENFFELHLELVGYGCGVGVSITTMEQMKQLFRVLEINNFIDIKGSYCRASFVDYNKLDKIYNIIDDKKVYNVRGE